MGFKPGSGAPPFTKKGGKPSGKTSKPISRSPMKGRC